MALDFDRYKREYDRYTFTDLQSIYHQIAHDYPVQRHFHSVPVKQTLWSLHKPRVLELGGWDGALADVCGGEYAAWDNYDLVRVPQACRDPRYQLKILTDWFWNSNIPDTYDVFIATHLIEHLNENQLEQLFRKVEKLSGVHMIHLESPISEYGQTWKGTEDTHVLNMGWRGVRWMLADNGFKPRQKDPGVCVATR